jgi:hypothetical protein
MFNKLKLTIHGRLIHYVTRLRFPKLLALAAVVFVVDLIFPDVIPFADEILLGLMTLLLGMLKKRDPTSGSAPKADEREGKKEI